MPPASVIIPTTTVIRASTGRSTSSFRRRVPSGTIVVEATPTGIALSPGLAGVVPMAATPCSLIPGTRIDGVFEILAPLASSGGGELYAVVDRITGRALTMKIQSPEEVGRSGSLRRFRAEAAALAAVDHPAFPVFAGKGCHAGRDYMLLERLIGTDLKTWLAERGGRIPEGQALDLLLGIVQGMQRIHEISGMIHRDLKPSHLILPRDGDSGIRITGFGYCAFQRTADMGSPDPTGSTIIDDGLPGRIVGTPAYMSPEQCQGAVPGMGMDVYALGCVFHQMLTGRPPFLAPTTPALFQLHQAEVPPTLDPALGIAPGSVYVVNRCLAKRPQERFRSYAAFAEAIRAAQYQLSCRQRRNQTTRMLRA